MILITGDCHGNFSRFTQSHFKIQKELTKEDYVIICGDFGGIWANENNDSVAGQKYLKSENYILDELDNRNFTTLFIDGNHENHERLNAFPVEEWHGGKVHKIRPSVIHLMRGQVYEIDGKKIFTFGGAPSHDIKDGILEIGDPLIKVWDKDRTKLFRINHLTWWKEEVPNDTDWAEAEKNLAKHNYKVDYIITHECPAAATSMVSIFEPTEMSRKLMHFYNDVKFKHWYGGHYHLDDDYPWLKYTCLYSTIQEI